MINKLTKYVETGTFYKAVVEDGSDLIFIVDYFGLILYHNPAVKIVLGYEPMSLVKKNFFDFIHPESVSQFKKDFKKCTDHPYSKNVEFQFKKSEGNYTYLEFNSINLKHKEGFEGFILDCRDVEQRKRDAEELLRAKEAKEKFLANMSHEIRTPINGIGGMVNLLSGTNPTSEQEKFLGAIKNSTDNLKVIINDILDLSAIESGKLHFEKIGFKLSNLLPQIIETFIPQAESKGVSLTYKLPQKADKILLGDPVRLSQVLINLISNAIKFTFSGEIYINIKFKQESKKKVITTFEVTDTGIGIPEDKLESIFDTFRQADESITRKFGGTGLGLSIVQQLIDLQGGQISVKSKENKGSTFAISLPYDLGSDQDLIHDKDSASNKQTVDSKLPGMRVLLVEDNDINRLYAANLMKKWDCEIDQAENGLICIEKLNRKDYDIILMDIQMPVMDGFEATRSIRNNFDPPKSKTPIIALTANAIRGDNEKCIAVGMNKYLSKPFVPNELFSVMSFFYKGSSLSTWKHTDNLVKDAEIPDEDSSSELTNLEYLKSVSNNDTGFIKEMLSTFITSTPDSLSEMKVALDKKDYQSVGRLAHKIKPSISFVGITSMKSLVKEVELLGKENGDPKILKKKSHELISTLEIAIEELQKKLVELK